MTNNWYTPCARCGTVERKTRMRPLYTAPSSSMPPHLMGYLCESCYAALLDWADLADPREESEMHLIDRDHCEADLRSCLSDSPPQFSQGLHCALGVLARQMEISSAWTWISVEDRLPDCPEVLVVCHRVRHGLPSPPFCALAKHDCSGFYSERINMDLCEVTHWAPLPPLPGEVEA